MPSAGSIASNLAVCCVTGIVSRWFGPATVPACPGCPTCPTCPAWPGAPATPATPATPTVDVAVEASWGFGAYAAALVLVSIGPKRIAWLINTLLAPPKSC